MNSPELRKCVQCGSLYCPERVCRFHGTEHPINAAAQELPAAALLAATITGPLGDLPPAEMRSHGTSAQHPALAAPFAAPEAFPTLPRSTPRRAAPIPTEAVTEFCT